MVKALLIVTLLGAALRIYDLGKNSLWLDEAWTWYFSSMSWRGIWETTAYEYNPPGFYWITKAVMYFGQSEIWLRLVPCLAGIAEIPVMYLIGKEFFNSKKAGLIAAIFMALSPFAVWYSQEVRTYTLTLLLVSLAFYYWLKGKHVLFGVFSALAFWTHFYVIIPFVIVAVLELKFIAFLYWDTYINHFLYRPGTLGLVLKPMVKHFAAFLIIAAPILFTTTRLFFIRTAKAPTYGMGGFDIITNTVYALSGNHPYFLPLTGLFLLGMWLLYKTDRGRFWMLTAFTAGPLIISFIFSYLFPMLPRYLIWLLPFFILGTTAVFHVFGDKLKYAYLTALVAFVPFAVIYYPNELKQDWRNSVGYVESRGVQTIVVMPKEMDNPFNYYYRGSANITYTSDITAIPDADLYIVADDFCGVQSKSVTLAYLDAHYRRNDEFTGIHIYERE